MLEHLGETLDKRELTLVKISNDDSNSDANKRGTYWITARQHPGETMAEWLVEGLLYALLDSNNATSKVVLG